MRTSYYSSVDDDNLEANERLVDLLWGAASLLDPMHEDKEACAADEEILGADAWVQFQ